MTSADSHRALRPSRRGLIAGALAASAVGARAWAAPPGPGLIDIHHHAIPDFWFEAASPGIAAQVQGRIGPQWTSWTPEVSLAAMDRWNIALSLLSISAPGTWFGDVAKARVLTRRCNDRLAEIAHARPDRFGFHATLALPDVDGSLAEVGRALDVLKADGVGLMTSYEGKYLGDKAFDPIFAELNKRKAAVYVHPVSPACCSALTPVSPNFVEFLQDTNRAVLNLMFSGTFRRYPDIRFIFSHAGGSLPVMAGRISGLTAQYPDAKVNTPNGFVAELKKLNFDIANSTTRATFGAMAALIPMSQVVVGTDFPIVPLEATLNGLDALGLSPEDHRAIARDNALRLFPQLSARVAKA